MADVGMPLSVHETRVLSQLYVNDDSSINAALLLAHLAACIDGPHSAPATLRDARNLVSSCVRLQIFCT